MDRLHIALLLLLLLAIQSTAVLADHVFMNCSSLEQIRIKISVQHAQSLIAIATLRGSSEFIANTDLSDSSRELSETNRRWRADVFKTIALDLPEITFSCDRGNKTIESICDAARNDTPKTAEDISILLVKTDVGKMALCQHHGSPDIRSAALPVAHELVEIAKRTEQNRRAEVVENLTAVYDHALQIIEGLRKLLLSLEDFYATDFWKRNMDRQYYD